MVQEVFTDEIIDIINERSVGLVFLLWGMSDVKTSKCFNQKKDTMIKTSHPSPLTAMKINNPILF